MLRLPKILALICALGLAGCAGSPTALPQLSRDDLRLISADEAVSAIKAMVDAGQAHDDEALAAIERSR